MAVSVSLAQLSEVMAVQNISFLKLYFSALNCIKTMGINIMWSFGYSKECKNTFTSYTHNAKPVDFQLRKKVDGKSFWLGWKYIEQQHTNWFETEVICTSVYYQYNRLNVVKMSFTTAIVTPFFTFFPGMVCQIECIYISYESACV